MITMILKTMNRSTFDNRLSWKAQRAIQKQVEDESDEVKECIDAGIFQYNYTLNILPVLDWD